MRFEGLEFRALGWPPDGPKLDLDHREFGYAGKFVMTSTGKAVAREVEANGDGGDGNGADRSGADDGDGAGRVVAAVAFNEDRTDPTTLWIRYVTVRDDRRGEGVGPRLAAFVAERARDRGYERARIAVNNPFAYHALYKAGFRYTGERTGIAELVLERVLAGESPPDRERYVAGLSAFLERDLPEEARRFVREKREAGPPDATP